MPINIKHIPNNIGKTKLVLNIDVQPKIGPSPPLSIAKKGLPHAKLPINANTKNIPLLIAPKTINIIDKVKLNFLFI